VTEISESERHAIKFLNALKAQWNKRFESEDAEADWTSLMVSELQGFSEKELDFACRSLLRKKLRGFPLLAECHEACKDAREFFKAEAERNAPKLPLSDVQRASPWSWERQRLALDLMQAPMGKRAAREGWISGLFQFCRENMALPPENFVSALQRQAKQFDEHHTEAIRDASRTQAAAKAATFGTRERNRLDTVAGLAASSAKIGESIAAKRELLRAIILREEYDGPVMRDDAFRFLRSEHEARVHGVTK